MKQLSQAKDTQRLSDLRAIDNAIKMFIIENLSGNLGSANTVYISLPSDSSTCANLDLPYLPSGWSYRCANQNNYRKTDGSGWIPINLSYFLPLLPIDPKNNPAEGLYYTYVTGSSYVVTSKLESKTFLQKIAQKDNGTDSTRYELGSNLSLWSQAQGLVGYWKMDEGKWNNNCSDLTVIDSSDKKNHGKSCPNLTGPLGGAVGKINNGGNFDGINDFLDSGNNSSLNITDEITIEAWIKPKAMRSYNTILVKGTASANYAYFLAIGTSYNNSLSFQLASVGGITTGVIPVTLNNWYHVIGTRKAKVMETYINGKLSYRKTNAGSGKIRIKSLSVNIGKYGTSGYFNGLIDEVRIYKRSLKENEIKAHYEGEK